MSEIAPIILAIATLITALVGAYLSLRKEVREVHTAINGRMDELLRMAKSDSDQTGHARGVADEKAAGVVETAKVEAAHDISHAQGKADQRSEDQGTRGGS